MSDWLNIPVKERIGLLREYKKLGYSYSSAKKDFEDSLQKLQSGGLLETSSMLSAQEIPQNNLGMTGMMKGTIAREAHFGNPAAQRMVSPNPKIGITPEGWGTHYIRSYGKYAIPKLQDTGQDSLQFYPNKPPLKEAIKFNTEKEAEYFAEHYKDVAPMMKSFPKYENGGELNKSIPTQQPASSTNVVGRNPMFDVQLMQREQLKQDLFQEASKGNPEAEQQFRETFGTSTHRYRYDNDPQYREQVQTTMREHTGAKIDYPSTDLRREGNIPPNTAWMYPQLEGKGKQAMTQFSNEVIETALPIPGIDKVNKAAKIVNEKGLKAAYYQHAPWTWKPNPDFYYRAGNTTSILDDVLETGTIRAVSPSSGSKKAGRFSIGKEFPETDTYWSKGVPLDINKRYYTGEGATYGNYVIEASDEIPFVKAKNQRTYQFNFKDNPKGLETNYNNTHKISEYVKPRDSYGLNELGEITGGYGDVLQYNTKDYKLLEPHWFYGYKEYKPKFEYNWLLKKKS